MSRSDENKCTGQLRASSSMFSPDQLALRCFHFLLKHLSPPTRSRRCIVGWIRCVNEFFATESHCESRRLRTHIDQDALDVADSGGVSECHGARSRPEGLVRGGGMEKKASDYCWQNANQRMALMFMTSWTMMPNVSTFFGLPTPLPFHASPMRHEPHWTHQRLPSQTRVIVASLCQSSVAAVKETRHGHTLYIR